MSDEKKPERFTPLAEHSRVVAVCKIEERGTVIPRGAIGTIVNVVRGGGYDVEFTTPIHAVVATIRSEIAALDADFETRRLTLDNRQLSRVSRQEKQSLK